MLKRVAHVYITISAKAVEPSVVNVWHDGEFFQIVELPYTQEAPDDQDLLEKLEYDGSNVPDSYGPVTGLRCPPGIFAIAAYRGRRFLFILMGGPGFLKRCNRDEVANVVADAEAHIQAERNIIQPALVPEICSRVHLPEF